MLLSSVLCAVFLFCAGELSAQTIESIGRSIESSGMVQIFRDNALFAQTNERIENFDTIYTNEGSLRFDFTPETGISGTVNIQPESVVSLEHRILPSDSRAPSDPRPARSIIHLFAGRIDLGIEQKEVEIRSGEVVITSEAAQFTVVRSDSGSTLVAVGEGLVQLTSSSGQTIFANTGEAAEYSAFALKNTRANASSDSVNRWLRSQAPASQRELGVRIQMLSTAYLRAQEEFLGSYRVLFTEELTHIREWFREDRLGIQATSPQNSRLNEVLQGMRPLVYELKGLIVHIAEYQKYNFSPDYTIQAGLSYRSFIQQFEISQTSLEQRLSEVNYLLKLQYLRSTVP